MARLVALAMPGGPAFVDAVIRIWEAGHAVAPLPHDAGSSRLENMVATVAAESLIDAHGVESRWDTGRPAEDGDGLVMMTSGTSGRPRAVVLTHQALEAAAYASATAIGVDPEARWLACLPLHHIGGFGVISRALITGAGLEVHARFDAQLVAQAAAGGCTHTSLVPTALGRIDAKLFRKILVGGSALPRSLPENVIGTYGMTESCGGVVYDGLPLSGVEARIDDDGGIELRSPTLLRCYRDGTDPKLAGGWYSTGDLGSIDRATGRLTVLGRVDDLIITGGEKVWPAEVEAVLVSDPGVVEAAVVGRPDAEWGQRVVAIVVPSDPASPPALARLRVLVKERLGAHAAPKELELVDHLPRTALGKLRRNQADSFSVQ